MPQYSYYDDLSGGAESDGDDSSLSSFSSCCSLKHNNNNNNNNKTAAAAAAAAVTSASPLPLIQNNNLDEKVPAKCMSQRLFFSNQTKPAASTRVSKQQTLIDCSPSASSSADTRTRRTPTSVSAASLQQRTAASATTDSTRYIVHVDIDCFYCQCEQIDRKLPEERPVAIGQKHIIVTCNYAARRYGVGKLELRERALAKCPGLLILEGSDLEQYRIHSRNVYQAFRNACHQSAQQSETAAYSSKLPAVCKGSGMDEMMADITALVVEHAAADAPQSTPLCDGAPMALDPSVFVYGEPNGVGGACCGTIELVEDQSGDSVCVSVPTMTTAAPAESGTTHHHRAIRDWFRYAAYLALQIRQAIFDRTGFTTTVGLSINPFLAKIASGLQKPATVNILYPWHVMSLIPNMPLRKIPGIGYRTMKLLIPALMSAASASEQSSLSLSSLSTRKTNDKGETIWTCRDLSRLSHVQLMQCLGKNDTSSSNNTTEEESRSTKWVHKLRNLCLHGHDDTRVVDDEARLSKLVSCENSFRRGSLTTWSALYHVLGTLYARLPRLLHQRIQSSCTTSSSNSRTTTATASSTSSIHNCAFPTTIRLTIRFVVKIAARETEHKDPANDKMKKKQTPPKSSRPFVTKSKQCPVNGKALVRLSTMDLQAEFLRRSFEPLLKAILAGSLSSSSSPFDITRINIALTNFQEATAVGMA